MVCVGGFTIAVLESKMDEPEMTEKNNNIIVEGLKEETEAGIATELNNLLDLDPRLLPSDIATAYRLNPREGIRDINKKPKIKIVFNDKVSKAEVMKSKTKLKGTSIWINDDLTTYRSGLAYEARQAMRAGKIEKTWCHDGKVFVKKSGIERPTRIFTAKDILN